MNLKDLIRSKRRDKSRTHLAEHHRGNKTGDAHLYAALRRLKIEVSLLRRDVSTLKRDVSRIDRQVYRKHESASSPIPEDVFAAIAAYNPDNPLKMWE